MQEGNPVMDKMASHPGRHGNASRHGHLTMQKLDVSFGLDKLPGLSIQRIGCNT